MQQEKKTQLNQMLNKYCKSKCDNIISVRNKLVQTGDSQGNYITL